MSTSEVQIHVMIDDAGDYVVAMDPDELVELFEQAHGSISTITNVYCVQLTVPTPKTRVVAATVTDDNGPVRLTLVKS